MEIGTLLGKIRDSYDMLRHLQSNELKEILKYNKDRIVDLDNILGPDTSSSSSSSDENSKKKKASLMLQRLRSSVIERVGSQDRAKRNLKRFLPSEVKNAFSYSVISGAYIDRGEKE